jgi:cell division protein FtsI/penicillin-binding protein 2
MKWKINAIAFFVIFLFVLLFFRILYIQTVKGFDYKDFLKKQLVKSEEVRNLRGNVYDRNGNLLVFSNLKYSYFCFPKRIKTFEEKTEASNFIFNKLKIPQQIFLEKLQQSKGFFWITRKFEESNLDSSNISISTSTTTFKIAQNSQNSKNSKNKSEKFQLPKGLDRVKEEKRFYPNDSLASHVLGYTGLDNKGLSGIEYSLENTLKGSVLKIKKERDAKGRDLQPDEVLKIENTKSQNVYLTIDKHVQFIVEKSLLKMFEKNKPEFATAIVQDIKTGEILALANLPTFNANEIQDDIKDLKNDAVSKVYEPGSTLKILVAGAALEEKLFTLKDKIYCERGKFAIYDHVIKDHDKAYEFLTLEDVLAYSSNVGMAKVGEKLGKKKMYYYLQKFGFGCYTGIELPGEERGLLKNNRNMYDISPYILAFGQGLGVTPIQLITAFSAVANKGIMVEPRIIKSIEKDGIIKEQKTRKIRRILSEEVCSNLMKAMEQVVLKGTAQNVKIFGYKACGKTGTAQKLDKNTKTYSEYDYIASFVGIFPSDRPRFAILVIADTPKGIYWGGDVCGPVFKNIAKELSYYYQLPQN